jgi:hypothetical protein
MATRETSPERSGGKQFLRALSCVLLMNWSAAELSADPIDFQTQVWPILQERCATCHGGAKQQASLRVDSLKELLDGGDSGAAVIPNHPEKSQLLERVSSEDPDVRMPPEGKPLTPDEIGRLREWIRQGARWPEDLVPPAPPHWAYQPIGRPDVPHQAGVGNPIDAFLLKTLADHQLAMSPPADPRTLIRRMTLDLTGLPPTTDEVAAFTSEFQGDAAAEEIAVRKLVDRLLASPRYGERWAQHWLDVIRYADTQGYEANGIRPGAWPYRDYVIRALNADLGYQQFIREQLAGDVLGVDEATGFLVTPPFPTDVEVGQESTAVRQARLNGLDEVAQNVGSAVLGMTIGCARCHDHKFDPVTTRDYYRFIANFAGLRFYDRPWKAGHLPDQDRRRVEAKVAEIRARLGGFSSWRTVETTRGTDHFPPVRARWLRLTVMRSSNSKAGPAFDELEIWSRGSADSPRKNIALSMYGAVARSSGGKESAGSRDEFLNDGKLDPNARWITSEWNTRKPAWIEIELPSPQWIDEVTWHSFQRGLDPDNVARSWRFPTIWQIEVAEREGQWQTIVSRDRAEGLSESERKDRSAAEREFEAAWTRLQDLQNVFAGSFEPPDVMHVLRRGDPQQPRDAVAPGGIDILGGYECSANATEAERRLTLADWLASERNPLTTRVMVNRVWQHHFGTGLVGTPSDFGTQGERPSHPELLDWLARRFVEEDWKLKDLHRMICTSRAYRQRSVANPAALKTDSEARLLWRFPPRRLEAEAIRDSILFVSGSLDLNAGGPGINIYDAELKKTSGEWRPRAKLGPETWRRSIYLMRMRGADDGIFKAFDVPDCGQVRPRRSESTTPLQALNLFNSDFILEQSERFAERIDREVATTDDVDARLRRVFEIALAREPTPRELTKSSDIANRHGLATVCRAVFNSNEFLFIQ